MPNRKGEWGLWCKALICKYKASTFFYVNLFPYFYQTNYCLRLPYHFSDGKVAEVRRNLFSVWDGRLGKRYCT